jgi:S1-C subfamily serine protease
MIPLPEDVLISAVEKVSKSVVNIASVRILHDQMFRIFPVEGVGSGVVRLRCQMARYLEER